MKKLMVVVPAFAQGNTGIRISPPPQVIPYTNLQALITNAITVAFAVAALLVFIMLVWGAISWIMSGGDKDAVGKARQRIVHALIGLAILALAFLILQVVGRLVGFDITQQFPLPAPQ